MATYTLTLDEQEFLAVEAALGQFVENEECAATDEDRPLLAIGEVARNVLGRMDQVLASLAENA